jgi:hypothetical protein
VSNSIPNVEVGMMLCRMNDGRLTRGPIGVGTATGVQFPDTCPPGSKVAGSFHTHPSSGGGSILPSSQDMREAKRIGMPHLCIANESKTACYKVKGVQAAQTLIGVTR